MPLIDAVQAAGNRTDAETLTWLAESVEIRRDATPYKWGGLALILGDQTYGGVIELVESLIATGGEVGSAAKGFDRSLTSSGVDFTLSLVRDRLLTVRAGLVGPYEPYQPLIDALLAIGITYGPRYTRYGLGSLPSEADVAAARATITNQSAVVTLMNEVINPMVAAGNTVAEIKAAVAAWGA
jgi:hypothetical protein